MTRAIVIGESHTVAIAQALAGERSHVEGIAVYRLESKNRAYERDTVSIAGAAEIVQAAPDEACLFLAMLGTYHNILGLLRSGPEYDFLLRPDDRPAASAEHRIPHRAMATAFDHYFAKATGVRKLAGAAKGRTYLLSSPPPKQSNRYMMHRFMRQAKRTYHGKSADEVGLERPLSRLKLWSLEVALMEQWARSEGIDFVPAPRAAFNADGFLSRKFYFEDATHANARYGALVVDQICARLESRKEALNG